MFLLDFGKIKREFELEEKGNEIEASFTCKVNEKEVKVTLRGVKPPVNFENHFYVIEEMYDGIDYKENVYLCNEILNIKLKGLHKESEKIDLNKENYIGLIKTNAKGKLEYKPFIYKIENIEHINPVITEKYNDKIIQYLKKGEKYYIIKADPLRDITSGNAEKIKAHVIEKMENLKGKIFDEQMIETFFPVGMYKGYSPIMFFSKKLGFNGFYKRNAEIIVDGYSNRGKEIKTFHQFLYIFEGEKEEIQTRIKIFDDQIWGKELKKHKIGDEVTVISATNEKAGLVGLKGKVVFVIKDKIHVEFFNYFKTEFSPNDLEKDG